MKSEFAPYWIVWSASSVYSLWCISQASSRHYQVLSPGDFDNGWSFLHRKKDVSDFEWFMIVKAFKTYWPWVVIQMGLSQTLLWRWPQYLPLFYTAYSIVFLLNIIGKTATLFYVGYVLVMFLVHTTKKKILCFTLATFVLLLLHQPVFIHFRERLVTGELEGFLLEVGVAWLNARCLSFAVDRIDSSSFPLSQPKDLIGIFAYCFYIPVIFTGPIVNYSVFMDHLNAPRQGWTSHKLLSLTFRSLYYFFWYMVLEFLLHFIYSSAIQFYPELVEKFDGWTLCGLGYALPTVFFLKYFVIYGLAGTCAQIEQFSFPPPPKCISRIHLCSYFWRHFDRGLHLWISRYLYIPLVGKKWTVWRRVLASSVCFSFIFLWHGMDKSVATWSALNFIGVASEMVASSLTSGSQLGMFDRGWIKKFSLVGSTRTFQALVGTPLFMMMCLSCIFFLSNWDVGVCVVRRIVFSGFIPLVPTFAIMFCGCQVSIDVRKWEGNEERKKGFGCLWKH